MKLRKSFVAGIFTLLATLVFCMATTFAAANFETGSITATGYGVANPNLARNPGHARILARRAALVDAQRNLLEEVQGVSVTAETTVENLMLANDVVKTRVTGVINGYQVVSEQYNSDGTFEVTIAVSMFGGSAPLAGAVLEPVQQEAFPEPTSVNVSVNVGVNQPVTQQPTVQQPTVQQPVQQPSSAAPVPASASGTRASGNYTGLVVDCSGLGLKPVMSPVIKNDSGQPIYGYKNLNYSKVIANGMAGYASSMSNTQRAGANPLVVKAVSLDNHNGNPVISTADANRVLVENQASHFLDNCAVVFVR